jgi:hypothetical protein
MERMNAQKRRDESLPQYKQAGFNLLPNVTVCLNNATNGT